MIQGPARLQTLIMTAVLLLFCAGSAGAFPGLAQEGTRPTEAIQLDNYRVTIEFEKRDEKVARYVAEICSRSMPDLMEQLDLENLAAIEIVLVPRMRMYQRAGGPDFPEWGAAFAFMDRQIMVVDVERAVKTWNSLDKTVVHELSHLLLAQRVGPVPMPAWFLEGLAQWQAKQESMMDNWHLMNAVWSRTAPTLMQITVRFPPDEGSARTAYRLSLAAFKKLFDGNHEFPESVPLFLEGIVVNRDFDAALTAFRGEGLHQFSVLFMEDLDKKYTTHLLLFQEGPLFSIMAVLFVFMIVSVRIRSRRRLKRLELEERGL
jgi:hypothetical protein